MKTILVMIIVIALVASFVACGAPVATEEAIPAATEQTVSEQTVEPTSEQEPTPEPTEEPTPEPEPEEPQKKDEIVGSMLENPQELWSEGSEGFSENDGGEFGGGVKKGYNADMQRLEIFGEENGAWAKFNTSLMTCMSNVGMDKAPQQAVLIKFSASDITEAIVSFDALDEIDFRFEEDGVKFVDVANFFEMPISDFMPNNLELKNDTIYYFFFAFDAEGNIRVFVREDGFAENQAYFEYDLYQDSADINNCDLIMHLAIGANEQFNVYEYWIYTFNSFIDTPYFISAGDN